ncbi:hypothetical protein [Nostoc sp. FACHB-190]|uniref:hypothetical protein n=1 Tax=Nostoc sp. FACHB-190 TaxID=2692838 RepID=UPI0016878F2C|nr:hypothetical protein [Nostoc sp. FACHB-190]MBD2303231.1 hypothetical protein [Nostoc sp. FACHB-190]
MQIMWFQNRLVCSFSPGCLQFATTTSFMVVGTIFCRGVDRIEQSRGDKYQPIWIYNAKLFEGSAIASIAVFLGASLTGACVAGSNKDE